MKKNTFNICFSADNNYMEQLGVSIVSILKNSLEDEAFNFYVLNSDINDENRAKIEKLKKIKDFNIEFIKIEPEEFKNCKLLNKTDKKMSHYHVTLPTYFRYKIGSIFKDISKLLYIDCDIIVKKSLKNLFDTNLKDKYCAMILDAESVQEAKRLGLNKYFNAGVILVNLDLWRKDDLETKLFEYTKNNADKILWQDQDVINIVCNNKIKELGNEWNFQFFLYDFGNYYELVQQLKDAYILHLAGRFKPWIEPFEHPIFEEYYFYLSFTGWARKIQEYKYRCFGKYLEGNVGGSGKYVMSNDELFHKKLNPVYDEITKNYDYTNSEIKKTYEFTTDEINKKTEEVKNSVTQATDEKIGNVYSEITRNYDYTNAEIKKTDEKIGNIYSEITKSYDYINSEIKKTYEFTSDEINKKTEEKIGNVYSEITKSYDYINSEIKKTYEFTSDEINKKAEEVQNSVTQKTDEKIGNIYSEITKNYEFTSDAINKKAEEIQNSITSETETKINNHCSEINEKFEQKINELNETSINLAEKSAKQSEEKINKIYSQLTDNLNRSRILFREEKDKLKEELQEELSHFNKLSLNNSEEIKSSFAKLLEHLNSNNNKIFDLINTYSEKRERELLEKLNGSKTEIMSEVILPKTDEIKKEIRIELEEIRNAGLQNIKEITENEINTAKTLISDAINQINTDISKQQRQQQLDFEKQLLDMEMKFKELYRLLKPLISIVKKFSRSKTNLKNKTDERNR